MDDNHGDVSEFHESACADHASVVAFLLAAGSSTSTGVQDWMTPLVLKAIQHHTNVAAALLMSVADGTDHTTETCLHGWP